MAFVDPNQVVPGQVAPAQGQAPIAAGGAGVGGASKAAATPGQNVPAQPSAQLSAYLAANQPQATSFAGNVANTVGSQVNAAGAAINPAVNTYTGQLYSVPTDTNVNAKVSTAPSSLTPDEVTTFQNELGAAAKAPNGAGTFETTAPYQDLTSGIQKAVEQANLWQSGNSIPNLTTALAPFEGGNATQGDKTLDALLLSQTPGAYKQITDAVAPAAGLQGKLDAGTATANTALQNAIAADTAATPAAQGAAGTYATNLTKYLNDTLATNQAALNTQQAGNTTLQTDLSSGNLTTADALAMGIPADQAATFATDFNALNPAIRAENNLAVNSPARFIGYSMSNPTGVTPVDLSSYLTPGTAPTLNLANTASAQNYSDVAALQALLGTNTPALPINASTAGQAGLGLNVNAADTFNYPGAQSVLSPERVAAQKFADYLTTSAAQDPAQTSAQAAVMSQGWTGINQIIQYLNQLTGESGVGVPPPPPGRIGIPKGPPGVT